MKTIAQIIFAIVIRITLIILNVIVFLQYYNNTTDLLLFVTILNITHLFLCEFKGLSYFIPLTIGSLFVYKDFWLSAEFGLIYGTIITCVVDIVACIKTFIHVSKYANENE